ncbi:MAG: PAS domain S-box protein [Chloroflexota bacterium]
MSDSSAETHGLPGDPKSCDRLARLTIPESPWRLVAMVALSAFVAEVLAMGILSLFPPLSPRKRVFVDGLLVVLFLAPMLYLFLFRPLTSQIARRRRAEEALRQREKHLRTVADFAYDWEYWIDPHGDYVYNSPSCQRITGYTPEDFRQDPRLLQKMTHADDRAQVETHFREERRDGTTHSLDFRIITRNGDQRWINHACQRVYDEEGNWLGWRGSNRDITARKRAERARERLLRQVEEDRECIQDLAQALRRQRDRLQTIMESTHAQLAYLDAGFNFVRVNTAYAEGSGYSREELIGKNHFDLFPDAENQTIFERVRDTGEAVAFHGKPFIFPGRPELGTTYWDWTLVPVENENGEVEGVVLSLLDVTERERLMQALDDERAKLQAIIENAPEGIVVVDEEARITLTNPAAEALYERPVPHGEPYESHGDLCLCRLDGTAFDPRHLPLTRSALDGETHTGLELTLVRPDGEEHALLVDTAPIRDTSGKVTGAVGLFRDITERKRIEETVRLYADRLRVLHEIDTAVLAAGSAEGIAESAIPLLRELIPSARASVEVFDLNEGVSRLLAVDADAETALEKGRRLPVAWNRSLDTLQRGEAYVVEDVEALQPSPLVDVLRQEEVRSYVSVPLRARGELIGSLNLGRRSPGGLTAEEMSVLWEVAAQVAIGLRQAQLYREVRRHADELEERVALRTAELRASEARFRAVFEQAALGIALVNRRGELMAINPALQAMLGETNEALVGRVLTQFARPGAEADEMRRAFRDVRDGLRDHHRVETRYVARDGTSRWANVVLSLVRDARGEPEFIIALVEDITRRREAQADLRKSEQRQRLALQVVGGGIYEHPVPLDDTAYHSEGWAQVLGYRRRELPPYSQFMDWLHDQVHPDDLPRLQRAYDDFIAGRTEGYHVEVRMRHKGGHWVWVEGLSEATERDEEGRVTHLIGVMRDITERKETQAALLQSEKLATTGKLAASLAHEINNPLQAVIGCLGLAEESLETGEDDDFEQYIAIGLDELRRAAEVVSRLRDLSRPTDVKGAQPTDVNDLIDRVLTVSRKQVKSERIRVVRRLADDLPQPELVADRVQQIFLNLVLNAVEAMRGGGQLTVVTRYDEEADEVVAAFEDCGAGIPQDVLLHIFDPFYSTKSEGTGLGLFVSQNIAQEHGGRIEVESQEGEGATFTVYLPVSRT